MRFLKEALRECKPLCPGTRSPVWGVDTELPKTELRVLHIVPVVFMTGDHKVLARGIFLQNTGSRLSDYIVSQHYDWSMHLYHITLKGKDLWLMIYTELSLSHLGDYELSLVWDFRSCMATTYKCVCVCVCMYVCMHVCISVCMSGIVCMCIYICTNVRRYVCTYV
jgi:hypothetical protein